MKLRGFTQSLERGIATKGRRGKAIPRFSAGFTLIEMMVSVAIFATVMVIALGALLSMSESDRKSQTLKSVINNLNFSLDGMSRSMRTGDNYHCDVAALPLTDPRDCVATGASSIAYRSGAGNTVAYCRGAGTACSASGAAVLRSIDGGVTYAPITAPEVVISNLTFYVVGAQSTTIQPKITILLSGKVTVTATQFSQFNLQTSVTERLYKDQ